MKISLKEVILLTAEIRPLMAILAGVIAGVLVTTGFIDPNNKEVVSRLIDNLLGTLLIVGSLAATIHRYVIKHPAVGATTTKVEQTVVEPAVEEAAPLPQPEATAAA